MTYKELSEQFSKKWNLTPERLDKLESEFMQSIRNLLWHISADPKEEHAIEESMNSSYDAGIILENIKEIISNYNNVFHIVSITAQWKHDKMFDPNKEIEVKD